MQNEYVVEDTVSTCPNKENYVEIHRISYAIPSLKPIQTIFTVS